MISFLLLIIGLVLFDNFWSNWLKKQISEKQIWILNKSNRHFNLAFIGSSRVYTCINIDTVETKTGKSAINLGCDGASVMENYVILKQFLKAGNKIDSLYLQLDKSALIDMNKAYSYPFHDYLFLNKLNEGEIEEAVVRCKGYLKYSFWRFLPYFKYAEFNNFYNLKIFFPFFNKKPAKPEFDSITGSRLIDLQMPDSLLVKKNEKSFYEDGLAVSETSILYINKILALCKDNNIKCTFFKVPMYNNYNAKYSSSRISEIFLIKFSKEHNCRFIDFQKLELAANINFFKDYTHLNKNGADSFSVFLADSLTRK